MTRCIHCTRCVRFSNEIAGVDFFGTLNRGVNTEIGNYLPHFFDSEVSGNVIDLCPVGALTSKPYAFKARPWELRLVESIDLSDSLGSNIYINYKENEIVRILPKNNVNINENWITDKTRFSFDALKTRRLLSPAISTNDNNSNLYIDTNWKNIIDLISINLKDKKNLILVDDDLDLKSLKILKNIQNQHFPNVQLRKINNRLQNVNFESNLFLNKINEISEEVTSCIIIASNIKTENAILNSRLRSKYLNEIFPIYNVGLVQHSNIPLKTLNLKTKNLLKILEGKSSISSIFLQKKKTLFIIGNSLKKRIKNFDLFHSKD